LLLRTRKKGPLAEIPLVLAPCGELSAGALGTKAAKKRVFLAFSKALGLYQNIIWKASTELEKREIRDFPGKDAEVLVAPALPSRTIFDEYDQAKKPRKENGAARMVFLSRLTRKKNLEWLLKLLSNGVRGELSIDVVGPIEDEPYG